MGFIQLSGSMHHLAPLDPKMKRTTHSAYLVKKYFKEKAVSLIRIYDPKSSVIGSRNRSDNDWRVFKKKYDPGL